LVPKAPYQESSQWHPTPQFALDATSHSTT
jgi:hypothetical protein